MVDSFQRAGLLTDLPENLYVLDVPVEPGSFKVYSSCLFLHMPETRPDRLVGIAGARHDATMNLLEESDSNRKARPLLRPVAIH